MEFCHTMKSINFLNPFKPFYARFLWICALELKIIGVNMRHALRHWNIWIPQLQNATSTIYYCSCAFIVHLDFDSFEWSENQFSTWLFWWEGANASGKSGTRGNLGLLYFFEARRLFLHFSLLVFLRGTNPPYTLSSVLRTCFSTRTSDSWLLGFGRSATTWVLVVL